MTAPPAYLLEQWTLLVTSPLNLSLTLESKLIVPSKLKRDSDHSLGSMPPVNQDAPFTPEGNQLTGG